MILAPIRPGNPAPGPTIDGERYVDAPIITATHDITPGELHAPATGDPVAIRSATVASHTYYCWADPLLVSAIMTRLSPVEADPPW